MSERTVHLNYNARVVLAEEREELGRLYPRRTTYEDRCYKPLRAQGKFTQECSRVKGHDGLCAYSHSTREPLPVIIAEETDWP